jgi:hypothetical protein
MTDSIRVFVNARGFDVPAGASALDAVRVADAAEGDAVAAGARIITDSRGLPVTPDTPAYGGAIYRLVANRDRQQAGETAGG